MKLNSKSIFAAAALMLAGANANADLIADWYAGATAGFGGSTIYSSNNDKSWGAQSYGAIIGVDLPVVRFEGEYDFLHADGFDMNVAMGNAYVKLPGLAVVNPYIGVGVGFLMNAKTNIYTTKDIEPNVAYQGMLGATLNIPALPFKIDLEGRALLVSKIYKVEDTEFHAIQYDARIKLRYVF